MSLKASKRFFYEDNFARAPRLTMTWPSVYQYHPDAYALSVLSQYLTEGKKAPLNKILVEEIKEVMERRKERIAELRAEIDRIEQDNVGLENTIGELLKGF